MGRRTAARICAATLATLVCNGLVADQVGAVSGTSAAAPSRVETVVRTSSPVTSVVESLVRVRLPLPASVGSHPQACDWLSYLRYRDRGGPERSAQADRIYLAQPGVLEGAGAFDSLARNTVVQAAALGRHVEFWALDRRSNCLEDLTGIRAALAAGDFHVAVAYYYRNATVAGRTFAGFPGDGQLAWLQNVGLEQTVRDEYDLLRAELPDPVLRRQKVLCGGHSLGGVLTGFFASWDFDGDPATTADAGYNQCSGYFALDTTVSTSLADLSGNPPTPSRDPDGDYATTQVLLRLGIAPRTLAAPVLINAETMNLLAIAAVAADTDPDGQSDLVTALPSKVNIDATTRLLFSRDAVHAVTGSPSVKDFRLTNQAVLGALMDDNSQPLAFLQASVGIFDGGPLARKDFPLPRDLLTQPLFAGVARSLGKETLAVPAQARGPLYTWRNYDRVGAPDDPGRGPKNGGAFTTAAKEVTDIAELARSMGEQPLDFTEHHFPTKLVTDITEAAASVIASKAVHRQGLVTRPTITILAGDGLLTGNPHLPDGLHPIIAPGYQHLDVLTAAAIQNGGRPEMVSTSLARFGATVG